jgi:hypothetical protein
MTTIISGTSGLTFPDSSTQAVGFYGFKNRIINGGMVIDQRNAGASVTPAGAASTYTLDRWGGYNTQASKFTVQQNAGSVTPPAGYKNYLGVTSSSAYTPISTDQFQVTQSIEGLNTYDLNWGAASAATVTLSFWVRSSLTGTFAVSFNNNANNRTYPATYTINSANTWEQKTITVAGDQSGTWSTDTSTGIQIRFCMGYGSNFSGTANSWNSGNYLASTGCVNVVGTNGATWYVTGVQLEKGSTATSFDYRPYGTELMLCQRYCIVYSGASAYNGSGYSRYPMMAIGTASALWFPTFPVQMRATPTLISSNFVSNVEIYNYNAASSPTLSSLTLAEGDAWHQQLQFNLSVASTVAGQFISWRWLNQPNAYIGFTAEL